MVYKDFQISQFLKFNIKQKGNYIILISDFQCPFYKIVYFSVLPTYSFEK